MDTMPAMVEEFPITDFVGKSAAHAGTGDDLRSALSRSSSVHSIPAMVTASRGSDEKVAEAIHEAAAVAASTFRCC